MPRLVIASGNAHKVAEIRDMVDAAGLGLEVVGMLERGQPPDIAETAPDFAGNATLKARGIADWLRDRGEPGDTLVLADDSGVCVEALGGAPGVRSARFAGDDADDDANNRKLVDELRTRGLDRSPAHYACVIVLVRTDGAPIEDDTTTAAFAGRWQGEVRIERRGTGGFGYDPHAWIDDGTRTIAELSRDEKAEVSHRGQATRSMIRWLQSQRDR